MQKRGELGTMSEVAGCSFVYIYDRYGPASKAHVEMHADFTTLTHHRMSLLRDGYFYNVYMLVSASCRVGSSATLVPGKLRREVFLIDFLGAFWIWKEKLRQTDQRPHFYRGSLLCSQQGQQQGVSLVHTYVVVQKI